MSADKESSRVYIKDEEMGAIATGTGGTAPTTTAAFDSNTNQWNVSATENSTASAAEKEGPTEDPPLVDQLKELFMGSKIDIMYIFVPLAFFCHYASVGGDVVVFGLAFFALVPLAKCLGDLTEDIALRTNDAIGALINVTFGNATEIIISISALRQEKYAIITNSLVGSILGNMLLVLGTSLLVAGKNAPLSTYNAHAAQIYMSTLVLSSFAFIIPTCFYSLNKGSDNPEFVLQLSRELSVALIFIYGCYIYFQVKSHKGIFDGEGSPADFGKEGSPNTTAVASLNGAAEAQKKDDDDDDDEEPKFSLIFAIVATGGVALIISILSDILVDTMTPAADALKVGFHFTSLVLVPIVGNVAEHASAILMANKGKMDIAFGVALGSSIQIGMFAMPLTVLISMVMGKNLDMNLTPFICGCLFATVLLTYCVVSAGSSTWLSGLKLLTAYIILCMAFLRAPDQ